MPDAPIPLTFRRPILWRARVRIWSRLAPLLRHWPRPVVLAVARALNPRVTFSGSVTARYPIGLEGGSVTVAGKVKTTCVSGDPRRCVIEFGA